MGSHVQLAYIPENHHAGNDILSLGNIIIESTILNLQREREQIILVLEWERPVPLGKSIQIAISGKEKA